MSVPDLDFRPCGACNDLVPTDTGCPHWRNTKRKTPVRVRRVQGRATAVHVESPLPPPAEPTTPRWMLGLTTRQAGG